MKLRTVSSLAALTLTLGLSGQALAQTTPTQRPPATEAAPKAPVAGQIVAQDANTILASRDFIGQTVYAPDKAKIGSISDLILSKDGKSVQGFVIGVGGFLGIGAKDVALAPNAFQFVAGDPNSATDRSPKLKISMDKEQLKQAANFEPYKEPSRATTGTGGSGGAPRPAPGGMSK